MLDDLIKTLPKGLVAFIAICGGIAFILLNDPPHKFCDTQIEHFKSIQTGIILKDPKDKVYGLPLMVRLLKICRETVSPGACYEYFAYLNRLLKNFKLVSTKCLVNLSQIKEVKVHLFNGINTMTQLAWREKVLSGEVDKFNWFSPSDMSLFCSIKKTVILLYGRETLQAFEQTTLSNLPSSNKISLARLKKFSILSESCSKYH